MRCRVPVACALCACRVQCSFDAGGAASGAQGGAGKGVGAAAKGPLGVFLRQHDPPTAAELVHMFSRFNMALTSSYFTIGVVETFSFTPMTVYAVESLDADPDVVSILSTLMVRRRGHARTRTHKHVCTRVHTHTRVVA